MITAAILLAAASVPPPVDGPLQSLSFLVGHCWRGEFQDSGAVDTHCFEPVYDGKHIRDRHEVTGGKSIYRGETIYSWNAETKRVEFVYFNSLGGVSRGSLAARDGILDFADQEYRGPDGAKMTIHTQWRPTDSSYEVVNIKNGVTGSGGLTYRRVD